MFRFSGFTPKANNAINVAVDQACELGHTYIGSEHVLLGLLDKGSGVAYSVLKQKNLSYSAVKQTIVQTVGSGSRSALTPEDFTPRCRRILETAMLKAKTLGQANVGTEHILISIIHDNDSYGVKYMKDLGVDPQQVYDAMLQCIGAELSENYSAERGRSYPGGSVKTTPANTPMLNRFSRDLTEQARFERLDPMIGREKEIDRVIRILARRTKNNPCLIGEAGVGKTAIVEGLAQRIISGDLPEELRYKRLLTLDLTGMVAGAKYRGDFEERIRTVLEEASSDGNAILFIDELHIIMGAGAAEGAVDAANILKPQLARGGIQVIGATTTEEYRKYIEKDSALERRFQSVLVEEPSAEDAISILKGVRDRYEAHHHVQITDEAVKAAVELSARYINGRCLPDKAIDLMDEAASRVRTRPQKQDEALAEIENRARTLRGEMTHAVNCRDFELAASIRDKEKELRDKVRQLKEQPIPASVQKVTMTEVAAIVSELTGVELKAITQEEGKRLLDLEERLKHYIVGQQEAVTAVARAIRRSRAGLRDPGRPIGSFLFLGPTGVGKTELCRALSQCLFGSKDAMIRLDMSEYMEKHTTSRLIGSPPGYVGYDDAGQLTEKVRRKPYSVVLFDEIEKAHPDIFNLLLQILEDGILTDSKGRTVDFKNTILIMTSNVGARFLTDKKNLGFSAGDDGTDTVESARKQIFDELKQIFRPELLNRIDEILLFHQLTEAELEEIVKRMLQNLTERTRGMRIELAFTDSAAKKIAETGRDRINGARSLRREVQHNIEDKLAEKILAGQIHPGESILCDHVKEFVFLKV